MTGKQNRWMLIFILLLAVFSACITFSEGIASQAEKMHLTAVANAFKRVKTSLGLDIKGGVRVVLRAKTEEFKPPKGQPGWGTENLKSVQKILEHRVNATGVAEPVIITKEPDQIIVELPGLKDEKQALEQLQSTANLQFYLLRQLGNEETGRRGTWSIARPDAKGTDKEEHLVDATTGQPLTPEQLDQEIFKNSELHPVVTGINLLPNSQAQIQPNGNVVITFEFNQEGSKDFEDVTRTNKGEHLAVFLDKRLLTAPAIRNVISGSGIIEGNFTLEEAKLLSDQLNAGALPVPLEILETRKLEATLGAEAVRATMVAGVVGLGLVLLFMMLYYRLPGVLASVALILYAMFSLTLFKLIPVTLTLPGIAGFILSIGMAVDANILIFERLKEELRSGKTLRAAIDAGFKRAFTAILDSNVCTLITCLCLYLPGSGPVRGFALMLGLGVLVSMFTAITVTRTFLFALVSAGAAQNPAAYGLNVQWLPDLQVMKRKWFWLGISGLIIVPGLIFWVGLRGIKPSIDFTGGTELTVPFSTRFSSEQIQTKLTQISPRYKDSRAVVAGETGAGENTVFITTPRLTPAERDQVLTALTDGGKALAPKSVTDATGKLTTVPRTIQDVTYSDVSGTISDELTKNAFLSILAASFFIVLYLAVRFAIGGFKEGLKYGTCAVVALLHDVLVVWGAFAILGYLLNWQIDSLFVTAMLTVIGFSVHDTIIIFDRIRENLQHRERGENFSDLSDRSIDQTIARSLNTSFTVVLTLLALFFFGGGIIHQFVGALLIGIVSGTYSSIFNASVLLVLWKQRDTGLALVGAGAASGPKSGLSAKSDAILPGDRPLVTPPKTGGAVSPARSGGNLSSRPSAPTRSEEEGEAESSEGTQSSTGSRPGASRQKPVRRRRM